MKDNHFNFEDLQVYQKSLAFMDHVYEISRSFPTDERFNLTSQFRRATLSISLNVAEGSGATNKENIRYPGSASRTLKECVVCNTRHSDVNTFLLKHTIKSEPISSR
jgi:four helix bundle protein